MQPPKNVIDTQSVPLARAFERLAFKKQKNNVLPEL